LTDEQRTAYQFDTAMTDEQRTAYHFDTTMTEIQGSVSEATPIVRAGRVPETL